MQFKVDENLHPDAADLQATSPERAGTMITKGKPIMATVTIQEAQAQLTDLIHRLTPGDEVVITENNQPVARLVPTAASPPKKPRQFGTLKGTVLSMEHFDDPLEEFEEYMQ